MIRLEPYVAPAPVAQAAPSCPSCATFAPECLVPCEALGELGPPVAMCWLCAHAVTAHGATIETAVAHVDCACRAEEIFPPEVLARRRPACASGEILVVEAPAEPIPRWRRGRGRDRVARVITRRR